MSLFSFLSQYIGGTNTSVTATAENRNTGFGSVDRFRNSVGSYTDLARSDRFLVKFFNLGLFTQGVSLNIPQAEKLLELRCEDAELPGRTIDTINSRTYGPILKYPSLTSYSDINLTFLCSTNPAGKLDNGFPEKMIFENWMDYINPSPNVDVPPGQASFWNFNYKEDYARDIVIQHYGAVPIGNSQDPESTYAVRLQEVFPIAINQVSLGWGNDSVARLVVTFAYSRWERYSTPEAGVKNYADTQERIGPTSQVLDAIQTYNLGRDGHQAGNLETQSLPSNELSAREQFGGQ